MIDREDRWTIMFLAFGWASKIIKFLSCISLLWTVKKIWQNLWNVWWGGQKSLTQKSIHTKIHNEKKTLDDKEVNPFHVEIYDNLIKQFWPFSDLWVICERSENPPEASYGLPKVTKMRVNFFFLSFDFSAIFCQFMSEVEIRWRPHIGCRR